MGWDGSEAWTKDLGTPVRTGLKKLPLTAKLDAV